MTGYLEQAVAKHRQGRRVGLLLVFLAAALWASLAPAAGQEPRPELPGRTGNATAPEREPVILDSRQLSAVATQTTLEVAPVADTYIASNLPNTNFGNATGLYLGYNLASPNYGAERILMRFDLSLIPQAAAIDSARLRLYLAAATPGGDTAMNTILRRTNAPWQESGSNGVRWNTEPAWGEIRSSNQIGAASGWYEWDIRDLVADWVRGTVPNYGLEIIGDETVRQRERIFHARETTTDLYPRLIVIFTAVDATPPNTRVNPLPLITRTPSFVVSWTGTDGPGGSGIRCYDVRYRFNNGLWLPLLNCTTATSVLFTPGAGDGLYEFEARATDNDGNVEPFLNQAEARTQLDVVPPFIGDVRLWLPTVAR